MALDYRLSTASRDNSIFGPEGDDDDNEAPIEWSNLIFLPFHSGFKLIVLFTVIVKCILGPIQSVYPIVYCWDVMDRSDYSLIKYFYWYCCDPIYFIDTLLHIVHRQVGDKAVRREYLPKSAFLLLLDFGALIPFFRLMTSSDCPPGLLWPNLLAFTEFLIIYRVMEYFSLATTHSYWNLIVGFTIFAICTINCFTCFWLLITKHGLCSMCSTNKLNDWRSNFMNQINEIGTSSLSYIYGAVYMYSYLSNRQLDDTKPLTIVEVITVCILCILAYLLMLFVIMPKVFAESTLKLRRISAGYPHVKRLIEETRRRNPLPKAHVQVENFFRLVWEKRSGITNIPPEVFSELPRYLRLEIRQDMGWPLLYHSPTLRKRTTSFKRFLCEYVKQDFILPGEKLFAGPHSHSNLYYLKSGVVQILSGDEGTTPILSVGSGTIFGDINFFVPPLHRKVNVKCLTYCDVLVLTRHDYIKAFHKYPEDRRQVLKLTKERLKHAKSLYNCKQNVTSLDRAEEEGISWLKRRWWEISHFIELWNKKGKKDHAKFELPPEESVYHCAKYIGQLVLCTDAQLQTKSLFANVSFPWILVPNSSFIILWRKIVMTTLVLVLIIYPPNITRKEIPTWFRLFQVWTDLVYIFDICISLLTAVTLRESSTISFAAVMFARCKTLSFNLDLLSTIWIEHIFLVIGYPQFFYLAQFNRLIKIYMLFAGSNMHLDVRNNPVIIVFHRLSLTIFCFWYISAYVIYAFDTNVQSVTTQYFFGHRFCKYLNYKGACDPGSEHVLGVVISWVLESSIFSSLHPLSVTDNYVAAAFTIMDYFICVYCKTIFISTVYLRYRDITKYQNFVTNLKIYYNHYKIHSDLMRRLDRYLLCHWKYYQGTDVMNPNLMSNEPFDIYWKVQGEVAWKIIGESKAFEGADPGLIKELAYAAKFVMLPKKSTIFLFGVQCQNVTWIVQGCVKCEYYNEEGELLKVSYGAGYMLSVSSVFMGKSSLRTYAASTDCEILYITRHDFFKIIRRYPNEWAIIDRCISEFEPIFDDMLHNYVKKHRDYQIRLRERIFHARRSTSIKKSIGNLEHRLTLAVQYDVWTSPKSNFIKYWLLFRVVTVILSISNASLQGGSGALCRRTLTIIDAFCNCVTWIDILLKVFLAYYDNRGILIYDKRKCAIHYLTRGFLLDVIGALPWFELIRKLLSEGMPDDLGLLINTYCKYAHLYIVTGYCDYTSNAPTINHSYIVIVKWLLVAILTILVASHNLMWYCVDLTFNDYNELTDLVFLNTTCWLPDIFILDNKTMEEKLHLIYAESLDLAQCGLLGTNFGRFPVHRQNIGVGVIALTLMMICWYTTGYSLTMLVLNFRGNSLFQHEVQQLEKFLKSERVDKVLIKRATAHFTYWWMRTKGINIHRVTNERIGMVLRQDLNYFFFKRTFLALNTLLHGGEHLDRQLASVSTQVYILPDEEVIKEMDLTHWVFVVHRGKITVSENGEELNTLTKGSIFGQLTGMNPRPVKISAKSEGYTDLLQLNIKQFQQIINDDVRNTIATNPQSKNDYMAIKKKFSDSPYRNIRYILRGRKTILLPYMRRPMEARQGNSYSRWLYVVWLVQPFMAAVIVLILKTVESHILTRLYWALAVLDLIQLTNFVFEFFTMDLVVMDNKCILRTVGYRSLKKMDFYIDFISLTMPLLTFLKGDLNYQLIRLLRLGHLYNFHRQFCTGFKSKTGPVILKFVIVFLLVHFATSSWVTVACRSKEFPSDIRRPILPPNASLFIDYTEWVLPEERVGEFCLKHVLNIVRGLLDNVPFYSLWYDPPSAIRGTILFYTRLYVTGESILPPTSKATYWFTRVSAESCAKLHNFPNGEPSFVVPLNWYNDYIVALVYIVLLYTRSTVYSVTALTLNQIYFKLFLTLIIYFMNIWLTSVAINFVSTKYRDFYQYDYNFNNLITYLGDSSLSPALLDSLKTYTRQVWRRQSGTWLPELAQSAPMCLREDMLCALYMHHLGNPPLLQVLPFYFKRQLATRLKRIVLFPGKCIVQEGDIFPCIYFIHQGEVEKYYFDKSGENRFLSLLGTNGFFGSMAGLFPNFAFQFSYYTRTVVDLVYLRLADWQDLLDGYPDIKRNLYISATKLRDNYSRPT